MTINLSLTKQELYIYGDLPSASSYYVNLVSQLSNEQIGGNLTFDNISEYLLWFKGDLNLPEDLQNNVNEGYYQFRLYNSKDTLLYKLLVKCHNPNSPKVVKSTYEGGQQNYKTFDE